ncbi:MAG: HAMP domain-containing protein [Thermomicrobiales bacterium]|nr:HAMP domain-containing protein [Thermomicrobiales bacterium]
MVAAACLLPLLSVTVFVLVESLSNGREQLLDAQTATAEVVAQVLAATLDDNERMLGEAAGSDRVQRLDATQVGEVLDQFKRARPNLYGLFLMDANRQTVAFAGLDPQPLKTTPTFITAVDRALTLGEPGVSNKLTTPDTSMIALTMPVHPKSSDDGMPVGVIGALLSVDRLKDTVLPFVRGDTAIAVVAEGDVIAAQGSTLDDKTLSASLEQPAALAKSGKVGAQPYADPTGEVHLAAYAPVPGAGWAVMVTHSAPSTYAPNRMLLERGLLALGLATVATFALVIVLGEWIARPLRELTDQASAITAGDFSPRAAATGGGEIATLGAAFGEMSDRLARQMHDLEAARAAGDANAAALRDLNRRTVRLQEDERRRIASDIHDAVSPLITGALYQARALQLSNGRHSPPEPGSPSDEELEAIGDLLARAMEELHGVVFALRPPDLDDLGVVAAIERHMEQVRRSGLGCRLETVGEPPDLTPEVRLAVYRIVQEALHNALRHGGADQALVRIDATEGRLRVTIHDNGAGFNPDVAARPTSLGLLSMRERAAAIGASFNITSRPGDGTTIVIERPIDPDQTDAPDAAPPMLEPIGLGEGVAYDLGVARR